MSEEDKKLKENFYYFLIQGKKDNNSFVIHKEETEQFSNKKDTYLKSVYAYIDNVLELEQQKELKGLIELTIKASKECTNVKNRQCYFSGIKDFIELFVYLFKDEILRD